MNKFLLTLLICSTSVFAQTPAPQPPCASAEAHQFDFWVGDWDLSWPNPQGGDLHGHNRIEREFDGCVIHENFSDQATPAFKGMSVSMYNPQMKKWQQTWVDNQASYLDFTGEFKGGEMVLSRSGIDKKGQPIKQRMVFKNIKPDSFDWSWEGSKDGGKTWQVQWPIHYTRKK